MSYNWEEKLGKIINYELVNDIRNIHDTLIENGFEEVMKIEIPVTIHENNVLVDEKPVFNLDVEIDKNIKYLWGKRLDIGSKIDITNIQFEVDLLFREIIHINPRVITGVVCEEGNQKEKMLMKNLTSFLCNIRSKDLRLDSSDYVIKSFHPLLMDLNQFFNCKMILNSKLLDDNFVPVFPSRWHHLRILVNEYDFFRSLERGDEYAKIAKYISTKNFERLKKMILEKKYFKYLIFCYWK